MSVEHRRPLYAFAVLVIVCGLFLGHAVRSDALDGVLRAATPSAPADDSAQSARVVIAEPQPAPAAAARVDTPATPVAPTARRAPRSQPGQASTTKATRAAAAAAKVVGSQTVRTPAAGASGDPADAAVGQPPTVAVPPVTTPDDDDSSDRSDHDSGRQSRWGSEKHVTSAGPGARWADRDAAETGDREDPKAQKAVTHFARYLLRAAKHAQRAADRDSRAADRDSRAADRDSRAAEGDGPDDTDDTDDTDEADDTDESSDDDPSDGYYPRKDLSSH